MGGGGGGSAWAGRLVRDRCLTVVTAGEGDVTSPHLPTQSPRVAQSHRADPFGVESAANARPHSSSFHRICRALGIVASSRPHSGSVWSAPYQLPLQGGKLRHQQMLTAGPLGSLRGTSSDSPPLLCAAALGGLLTPWQHPPALGSVGPLGTEPPANAPCDCQRDEIRRPLRPQALIPREEWEPPWRAELRRRDSWAASGQFGCLLMRKTRRPELRV